MAQDTKSKIEQLRQKIKDLQEGEDAQEEKPGSMTRKKQAEEPPADESDELTTPFQKKLPLLAAAVICFAISLFAFQAIGITLSDLLNIGDIQNQIAVTYSPASFIFVAFFALALSLTTYYGFNMSRQNSIAPLVIYLLLAATGLVFAPFAFPAYLAFAIGIGSAAIFASKTKEKTFDSSTQVSSRALFVLLVVVILIGMAKVQLNKPYYSDQFLAGAISVAPQVSAQIIPLCADIISKIPANQVVSATDTQALAQAQYEQYLALAKQQAPGAAIPAYDALAPDVKQRLTTTLQTQETAVVSNMLTRAQTYILSPDIQKSIQSESNHATPQRLSELRKELNQITLFQLIDQYFAIFTALIIFFLISTFNMAIKAPTYALNFVLDKMKV